MGLMDSFRNVVNDAKKKKEINNAFSQFVRNTMDAAKKAANTTVSKTKEQGKTTKTNKNTPITNPAVKRAVEKAGNSAVDATKKIGSALKTTLATIETPKAKTTTTARDFVTNPLIKGMRERGDILAKENYKKMESLANMRNSSSASLGNKFMSDFLSSDAFYYNLPDNNDFWEYAERGKARARTNIMPSKDASFDKYTMGNRVEETRKGYDVSMHYDGAGGKVGQMTDDEVDIYNYLLAKNGYDSAEAYVKSLEGELTNRLGKGVADAVTNASPLEKSLLYPGMSAARGLEQVVTGFDTIPAYLSGTKDVLSSTPMEIASEEVRDSIDSKIGRLLFDAGANVAAQVPRIGIGALTGGLGSFATTFLQSAGNDYRQAILEGRDPNKAQWHATGTGTLEASLQTLLNAAGGKMGIGPKTLTSKANLINNAFARSAAKFGIDMGSEILEEEGQLFLEPVLDTIIYGDDFSVPELDEIVDTALVTMISTGVLSGPNIVGVTSNDNSKLGQEFREFNDNDTDIVEVAIEEGLSTPKGSESYTIAKALDKKVKNGGEVSDHQLGTLIEANRRNVNYEAEADAETINNETFAQDTRDMSLEDRIRQAKAKEGVSLETPTSINPNAKVGTVDQKTISSFGYGKMGTEAITDIVSKTNMAPEQARRRFQSAYEAGRLNLDRSKIDLIDGIQETAYIAGRQDAILEMDTLKNNEVSNGGKKSGIVRNEFSAKYDKKTYSTINTIAKAMGTKIIVENIPQEMNSNGYYRSSDGTIHIDANLDEPVMTVVKHEITHRMKDLAPKEYMAYRDFAVEVMSDWGLGGKTTIETFQLDYRNQDNADIDVSTAMDEIAADMTRAILSDEKALKRFIDHAKTSKANMNMANKFFQAVREFFDKVKAAFSGNRQKMDEATRDEFGLTLEQLERAESLWKEAYRASEMSAKKINEAKTTGTDTSIKKSLKKGDNKIYNYNKTFAEQIEDWKKGLIPENDSLLVGATPEVFKQIGFNDLPVTINQKHVDYAVNGTLDKDHFLGETLLKQLPQALKNPVAIIKSQTQPNRVVAILKIQHNGKNIIAAVQVDGYGTQNNVRIDSNSITSVFGKNNAINKLLVDSLNDEANKKISVFYWNKKEALSLLQRPGLQLPNRLPQDGFIHSIREKGANVNIKFKNVTETQQFKRWFGDSKATNKDGTPKIFYHGTLQKNLTEFKKEFIGSRFSFDEIGFFFIDRESIADDYAHSEFDASIQGDVLPVFLKIENPLVFNKDFAIKNGYGNVFRDDDAIGVWDAYQGAILDEIEGKKFDGIIIDDGMSEMAVVFEPNQIKSATDNVGTFDKNDPDIRHSRRREGQIMKDFRQTRAGEISPEEAEMRYDALVEQRGAISKGENPARDIEVPRKTADGKKVSQTARTILEAGVTPDEALPDIKAMVTSGVFSYDTYTDKKAIEDAEERINSKTWNETLNKWFDDVKKGKVSKANTALGWALYNNAVNTAKKTTSITEKESATNTALDILNAMVEHQRNAAQALQATRILKKLSPETQLYNAQRTVSSLQRELTDKYGKKAPDLKIDPELAQEFLNADTQEVRDNALREIYRSIGKQMPSNWVDKFNAWRYLAMLGNLRTHTRNVVGNAGFVPVVLTKDTIATGVESVLRLASGRKFEGSKAFVGLSKKDRALIKAAWKDYSNVSDIVSGGGKYNDSSNFNKYIEKGRQIFKTKPLEGLRKGNSALLELEDMWFSKPHYAYALAQYCKAHNITAEQLARGMAIAPAREYAIKEAQKATYRDTNAFSQMVSGWGRTQNEDNIAKKAFGVVMEGTLPFRKTPANILVRGVEYSPIGFVKSLSYDLVQVKKGKITAADVVDNLSAGLTGTGLLVLGIYLAAQGIIRGHGGDDEEENEFKELMGHQAYSLEVGDNSVTLDWLAPEALPFFVGVNLWEMTEGKKENIDLATILTAVGNVSEPMLEMSCLQSLNDLFDSVGYATSDGVGALPTVLASAATSYLTQFIPTIFGQAERSGEDIRMTTYTEKNKFLTSGMQRTLGKVSAKIPGWDFNQIPYIDAWGRKEASGGKLKRGANNFLNPAYTSNIEMSDMEKELLRLYETTGEDAVLPKRADKSFKVDGVEKALTGEEYVRYATKKGQVSYNMITELVSSEEYKTFTDEEKVQAIQETYKYSDQKAKSAVSAYKPSKWTENFETVGAPVYTSYKIELSKVDDNGNYSIAEKADAISAMGDLSNDELAYLWDTEQGWEAYEKGIRMDRYIDFKDNAANFKADKDANGKSISGTKKAKVVDYLEGAELTDEEWNYFYYELMGYKK